MVPKLNYMLLLLLLLKLLCFPSVSSGFFHTSVSNDIERNLPSISLMGVIVSSDLYASVAVFKNEQTGEIVMLQPGESIAGMKLTRVFKNRVILKDNGHTFQIFLGRNRLISTVKEKAISKPSSETLPEIPILQKEFKREDIQKKVQADWPTIMKETRFVPHLVEGKISGIKITRLPQKSVLSEIGIQKDDIVKEINNIELNSLDTLFSLYNRFKSEKRFEVNIERSGKALQYIFVLK